MTNLTSAATLDLYRKSSSRIFFQNLASPIPEKEVRDGNTNAEQFAARLRLFVAAAFRTFRLFFVPWRAHCCSQALSPPNSMPDA